MFVYYFLEIRKPFPEVEDGVLGLLESMDELGSAAYREGEAVRARIEIGGSFFAKTVRLHAGFPRRGDKETSLPITWEATGTPGLFPHLEGDIVIASIAPDLTQLSLRGSYKPPLGAVGRALDRTVLHRIAETSVKSFVDRLASAVTEGIERPAVALTGNAHGVRGGDRGNHPAR